ncbi:hypothetical protein FOPE_02580 [Fonsecaea pedrosoi]|nr:hypothetical protein FOPE_02580 [Fonsecaea pedrosoi]
MASNHNPRCLWQPHDPSKTMLSRFRRFVNERHRLDLKNYQELWQYSIAVETANDFWVDAFVFLGLKGDVVPTIALASRDRERFLPPPIWFPEVKLNFTEILLADRDPQRVVLHTCTEGGNDVQDVTWGQLIAQVTRMADAMKSSGVVQGDRVAGVLSNRLETVVACLATLSMGAIWSTSSPDMGVEGVLDRVRQIRPKLLLVESDVLYNERILDQREKNRAYAKSMLVTPEFTNIVVIPRSQQVHEDPDLKLVSLDTFLKRAKGRPLDFKRLPFAHPGFIVYSSGTTGPPKCIVHSAAGLLLQSRKDSVLHFDVQSGDNILQYTTASLHPYCTERCWIMWGKVICGIGYGGRTVIYDGSPLKPDPLVLLRLVSRLRITDREAGG